MDPVSTTSWRCDCTAPPCPLRPRSSPAGRRAVQDAGQRPPAASTAAVRSGGCSLPCSCGLSRSAPPGPAERPAREAQSAAGGRAAEGAQRLGTPSWLLWGRAGTCLGLGARRGQAKVFVACPRSPGPSVCTWAPVGLTWGEHVSKEPLHGPGPPWQKGLIGGQPAGRPSLWALEPSSPGPMGWLTVEGLIGALARGLCWSQCAHCAFAGQWPRAVP